MGHIYYREGRLKALLFTLRFSPIEEGGCENIPPALGAEALREAKVLVVAVLVSKAPNCY